MEFSTTVTSLELAIELTEDLDDIKLFDDRLNYHNSTQQIASENFPEDFSNTFVLPENLEYEIEKSETKEISSTSVNLDLENIALTEVTTLNTPVTRTVNTTADTISNDGFISLREAIIEANSNRDRHYVIELEEGEIYNLTINGTREDEAATGDLDVKGNVTIQTIGEGKAIIDGSTLTEKDRIFEIFEDATLNLDDVIITGGGGEVAGGAIFNEGNLQISNSILENNAVTNRSSGGAIDNLANLNINSTILRNNFAERSGGAINNRGNAVITDSTISGNRTEDESGGGINNSGELEITSSTISGNTSRNKGGGIRNWGSGTTTIINSSRFENNDASYGGAIYDDSRADASLLITNSFVISNEARFGGAILVSSGSNITIDNVEIEDNEATQNGGAIYQDGGELNILNSVISGNSAEAEGGGIYKDLGTLGIGNSVISNNSASDGGGIYKERDSLTILGSQISSNTAENKGGGIYTGTGNTLILDSSIEDNTSNYGGGILNRVGTIFVFNSTINSNQADQNGGGLSNEHGSTSVINSTISGNAAEKFGGGIRNLGSLLSGSINLSAADTTLLNTTVTNNTADSDNDGLGDGGGISNPIPNENPRDLAIREAGEVTLRNTIVAANFDTPNNQGLGEIHPDASGLITGNANNLVGNLAGVQGSLGTETDIVDDEPGLGSLIEGDNGLLFHPLLPNSPAINAGNNENLPFDTLDFDDDGDTDERIPYDQRGKLRIEENVVDIGSIEFHEDPDPNRRPVVDNPILDVRAEEDDPNEIIDLTNVFRDPDGDEITLSIESNSKPELVAPSLNGNNLTLDFLDDQAGRAEITIRATADGGFVDDTFTVTVEPDDPPGDDAPVVFDPIRDITVKEDEPNEIIDLTDVFRDPDGDEITLTVQFNSNPELVTPLLNGNDLTLDFLDNQSGTAEITIRATANGKFAEDIFSVTVNSTDQILDDPINRFQNEDIPGTYLFAGDEESKNIRENFPNFIEEGFAFNVSNEAREDLVALYRFQSLITPGTYLFAESEERDRINENFPEAFIEEGLAFYVYGAGSGNGTEFTRFQNGDKPGTYLFADPQEAENIRNNFPGFVEEGIAFEAVV